MRLLGVFAKYWQPGEVKTRLAASLGPVEAAALHREFLQVLLRRLDEVSLPKTIAFTPTDRREAFAGCTRGKWSLRPQVAGHLGQRMRAFFSAALDEGFTQVVVVGSDSPSLPLEFVEQAFQELQRQQVVVGPSTDGGYYLIGVAAGEGWPQLFQEIPWGTSAVYELTLRRLRTAGLSFAELPPWYDVDRLDDLTRLHRELASADSLEPALAQLKTRVGEALGKMHDSP